MSILSVLHVTPPSVGSVVGVPSASTQKQRGPTHCSGRKSPSSEHTGRCSTAPAAMLDFFLRAVVSARSQRDGQREGRPMVRDPATSCPSSSTHQHSEPRHWTSWKPPLAVQRGMKKEAGSSSSSEQDSRRGVRTWKTSGRPEWTCF